MPSLNPFDLLMVMAQLAVAFAGFASLATALGDRSGAPQTRVDAGRLTNMLMVSLCTAMLSLAPMIPTLFGLPEEVVWRSSAAVAVANMAIFSPGIVRRTQRMKLYVGFSMVTNSLNIGLAVLATLAFLACALGIAAPRSSATYVAGLLLMLLISAIVFFRVIASLLKPHAPE
jgi:hypothetical protein